MRARFAYTLREMQRGGYIIAVGVAIPLACLSSAFAYSERVELGVVQTTVFAPDWIWQGQQVNVMAISENGGDSAQQVALSVTAPAEDVSQFGLPQDLSVGKTIEPGARQRVAITGIVPAKHAPLGVYRFGITVRVGQDERILEYPLKVIRGSLVEAGWWSVWLPALVCLVWSVSILVALSRFAEKGAWKRRGEPYTEQAAEERWFGDRAES